MEYAIDVALGRQVAAESARPKRRYRCPVCLGDVFLKVAGIYVAHFVHRHETALPDCENYHPGTGEYWPSRASEVERQTQKSFESVAIALILDIRTDERPSWQLVLRVPKPFVEQGYFMIAVGKNDVRKLWLTASESRSHSFDLDPNCGEVGITGFGGPISQAFIESIEPKTDRLDPELISVFSDTTASRKPRARCLKTDSRYVFLWPGSHFAKLHQDLNPIFMPDRFGWHCAYATISTQPTTELAHWLRLHTGLRIASERASVAFLQPIGGWRNEFNEVEVLGEADLLLSLWDRRALPGEQKFAELDEGQARVTIELLAQAETLIVASREQLRENLTVTFSDEAPTVFTFVRPMIPGDKKIESVRLGATRGESVEEITPLCDIKAGSILNAVRDGENTLTSFNVPDGVMGFVEEYDARSDMLSSYQYIGDGQNTDINIWFLNRLKTTLANRALEVAINFGAFGSQSIPATWRVSTEPVFPPRVRRQLMWLMSASGHTHNRSGADINPIPMRALVAEALSASLPACFRSHQRRLTSSLRRILNSDFTPRSR